MVQKDNKLGLDEDLSNNFRSRIKKREKRGKPKMKISGKRVFQLKNIFKKK